MHIVVLGNLIHILPALYTEPFVTNIFHFYAIYHLYVCIVYSHAGFVTRERYLRKAMDAGCRQFPARASDRPYDAEPAGLLHKITQLTSCL